ncbi:alpha-L-arabinofuranosidase C-terminal domain-containing protein [Chitinophaga sedimenti]|uniref:alpha-L-arabinofuranosidase C-terminal domain-containing protein n=1 Tax=Chitinophaga sedimenti TaxID=2033606 RepID=UPI0035566FCC
MYVGEYATNNGVGAGNMKAALSDAAYIMGMERNGDLVKMSSYAPLFENVNTRHWPVNLINFDASRSFGRISYYLIKMMNDHRADQNFAAGATLIKEADPQPRFTGGIGLATWDTQTDYKDIQVIKNGQVIYQSDLINKKDEWQHIVGGWEVSDSVIAMKQEGPQRFALLKGQSFDTYTLKLKARRNSGYNAFIIPFAVKDNKTMLRAHIGSWVNQNCVFESVTNGFDVADVSVQKRLPAQIATGRWYEITLEVGKEKVDCYLDGQLLMTFEQPQQFLAIAGRDEKNGDIIVKVVNGQANAVNTQLQLTGITSVGKQATITTLTAPSEELENSLDAPEKYVPRESKLEDMRTDYPLKVAPFSINILRIHDPAWKK